MEARASTARDGGRSIPLTTTAQHLATTIDKLTLSRNSHPAVQPEARQVKCGCSSSQLQCLLLFSALQTFSIQTDTCSIPCLIQQRCCVLLQLRRQRVCRQQQLSIGRPAGRLRNGVWAAEDVPQRVCSRPEQCRGGMA